MTNSPLINIPVKRKYSCCHRLFMKLCCWNLPHVSIFSSTPAPSCYEIQNHSKLEALADGFWDFIVDCFGPEVAVMQLWGIGGWISQQCLTMRWSYWLPDCIIELPEDLYGGKFLSRPQGNCHLLCNHKKVCLLQPNPVITSTFFNTRITMTNLFFCFIPYEV